MFVGILLLILGVLMILERLGLIYGSFWEFFWPAAVLALGVHLIIKNKR
jgi:hypothetical protein